MLSEVWHNLAQRMTTSYNDMNVGSPKHVSRGSPGSVGPVLRPQHPLPAPRPRTRRGNDSAAPSGPARGAGRPFGLASPTPPPGVTGTDGDDGVRGPTGAH